MSEADQAQSTDSTTETETETETGRGDDGGVNVDIAEALKIEDSLEKVNGWYENLLEGLGLSEGIASLLIGSLAVVVFFALLKFAVRYVTTLIRCWAENHRDKYKLSDARASFYFQSINFLVTLLILLLGSMSLMALWDINWTLLDVQEVQSLAAKVVGLLFVLIASMVVIELVASLIERYFDRKKISLSREQTIKPIAKNIVIGILGFMFSLIALSQLGIDILPLLAGAGVAGIAVGFGAQALVKDVISGFIIILEDLIQVGDIVRLCDCRGVVERITIRKVQLRDLDGSVYTVPFGEIQIVENLTKIYSYYLMDIGVAYRESVDEVIDVLKEVFRQQREHEDYADLILDDIDILGLDQFGDSAIIIKARIKTEAKKQWIVGREFNRRMKIAFDNKNIEIPFPHQTIYIGEDKEGHSPALNVQLEDSSDNKDAKPE